MSFLPSLLLIASQGPGQVLLDKIDAQPYPSATPTESFASYDNRERAYWQSRSSLVLQLYGVDPKNERLPKLLKVCWAGIGQKAATSQINGILNGAPPKGVEEAARLTLARLRLNALPASHTDADVMAIWADMSARCLYTDSAAEVLFECAAKLRNKENRVRQHRILAQLYPGFAKLQEVDADLRDWTGRPKFELDFQEACSHKPDSMCEKRGRVVLVYFSGGDAPHQVSDLFLRYHDSGLDALGIVSAIKPSPSPWPLMADSKQGVKRSWGVEKIPTVFLVDKEGCLAYANPTELEEHVKELLAQR